MRSQPVLIEQRKNVVDDRVLGFGHQVRLRERSLRNAGLGILPAELSDDVVEVLLRAEALALQYFHNRGDLPHVGDSGFLDGHALAFWAVIAHGMFSMDSCSRCQRYCS